DSLIFVNESAGATVYNARTLQHDHYLPGVEISHVFRDNDRNLWFATLGQGLYRLNSEEIRNFQLNGTRCHGCGVYAITKVDSQLLVGSARNSVFRYRLPDLGLLSAKQLNEEEKKRIMAIVPLKDGRLLFGTDFTLTIESGDFRPEGSLRMSVKSTCLLPQDKLLVGTGSGAFLADMHRMKVDTIWRGRTTAVYYSDSNIYIGTLNGLFRIPDGGTPYYMGKDDTRLSSRISGITGDGHGTMWVAPYDDMGVLELRDGKVVRRIGASEGLTSNICRVIALHGDYLWVGTDKGLNRINVVHPEQRIVKYTAGDGLGSNVINTVFFDSTRVYVGTSAGFNYFDETKIADSSTCRFAWLSVTANGRSRLQDTANLRFSYRASDFHFEFAGISYRSGGDISYRYRLTGLDTAWRMTQQNFLNYPVLPGGDYLLQVAAVDKWGHQSPVAGIHFIVSTPFWRQLWFFITVGLAIVALAWLLMMKRIRRIRRRQEDERALMRRVNEMEHMALQAQMNPHFIFNCMNSIQQYIFDQDIFGANKYISGFSRLIRATLQHSNRPLITLGEEIDYLSNYLSLERLRFKEKMEYRFEVDEGIDRSECMIPPMIIQPFAENSIRHGLRHKRSGKGVIMIRMQQVDGYLIVTIEDNGIGRRKAAMYKTQEHIEYQSRGMSLTAERIKAMNSMYGRRIDFSVTDLEDEAGEPAGTRVRIRF
ncbi:MAG TPA: histidine kinase, partial [Puia sp.]|nr:histidine kinase [Puia sp.]